MKNTVKLFVGLALVSAVQVSVAMDSDRGPQVGSVDVAAAPVILSPRTRARADIAAGHDALDQVVLAAGFLATADNAGHVAALEAELASLKVDTAALRKLVAKGEQASAQLATVAAMTSGYLPQASAIAQDVPAVAVRASLEAPSDAQAPRVVAKEGVKARISFKEFKINLKRFVPSRKKLAGAVVVGGALYAFRAHVVNGLRAGKGLLNTAARKAGYGKAKTNRAADLASEKVSGAVKAAATK